MDAYAVCMCGLVRLLVEGIAYDVCMMYVKVACMYIW